MESNIIFEGIRRTNKRANCFACCSPLNFSNRLCVPIIPVWYPWICARIRFERGIELRHLQRLECEFYSLPLQTISVIRYIYKKKFVFDTLSELLWLTTNRFICYSRHDVFIKINLGNATCSNDAAWVKKKERERERLSQVCCG